VKDWIKKALTKRTRQREIPQDPRLVIGVKFTIAMTLILSTLEITHIIALGKWNSEIFASIRGLSGAVVGIFVNQKT
jgi:hypothetical protein